MNTPRSSSPAMPLGIGGEVAHEVPAPQQFEHALQHLIAKFFQTQDQSEEAVIDGLERLFLSLAHELGRVDAAARLHGIPREDTLRMLRTCMIGGKQATLAQHEKDCPCRAAKVLQAELDTN